MHGSQNLDVKSAKHGEANCTTQLPLMSMQQAMLYDEITLGTAAVNALRIPITVSAQVDRARFVAALLAELAHQPAARVTLRASLASNAGAGDFGYQLLETDRPAERTLLGHRDQALPFTAAALVRLDPGSGDGPIWIECHHGVADRPGVEALLRRAAMRYAGATPKPAGSYAAAIAAVLEQTNQAIATGPVAWSGAAPKGPGEPFNPMALTDHLAPHGLAIARLQRAVSLPAWLSLQTVARAWQISDQQLAAGLAHAALERCLDRPGAWAGIPVSLRDGLPDPELLGCFIATLGICAPSVQGAGVADFLVAYRNALLESFEQRWWPAFGQPGISAAAQHVDLLFVWHDPCVVTLGAGTARLGLAAPYPGKVPLTLSAQPGPDGLHLALDYDPQRIDPAAAAALLDTTCGALVRLAAAVTDTAQPLPLLAALLDPPIAHGCPAGAPQPDLFAALARSATERPATIAVATPTGPSLTYAQLLRGIHRIAAWAQHLPSGPIALLVQRDPQTIEALLGLLQAGRTVALIDPAAAPASAASDFKFAAICGSAPVARHWPGAITLNTVLAQPCDGVPPDRSATAGVVIFTSGTSGGARPVLVGFDALARHAQWASAAFDLRHADRVLQFCAMAFDAMLEEVLPTLLAGATVVLRDGAAGQSGTGLLQFCQAQQISVIDLPTGFFNLAALDLDSAEWPAALRLIVIGGEAYQAEPLARWLRRASPARCAICTSYGPTEATIVVAFQQLLPGDPPALIGAPRAGADLFVLDRHGRLTPPGCLGELHLAGTVLARGYLGRAAETADRFVPNPFGPAGTVLYRTGDLVRVNQGRQMVFAGRTDRQVKLGGRRFEPDRVEEHLARLAGVPVHLQMPPRPGALPLLWASCPAGSPAAERLHRAIAGMPGWHRPATVRFGPLPLTVRGKIDRRAAADLLLTEAAPACPAAQSEWQNELGLVGEVLGCADLELTDDFLALGGNSLALLQLAGLCRTQLGKAPLVAALYADLQIGALCHAIRTAPNWPESAEARAELAEPQDSSGDPGAADRRAVSPYETALHLATLHHDNAAAYRITASWNVAARLDSDRFASAVAAVLTRHPLLSGRIVDRGGVLEWGDALRTESPVTVIDLQQDPNGAGSIITLATSHLACDGAGIARCLADLAQAYGAGGTSLGAASIPAAPPHRPGQLGWWEDQLRGAFATALPPSGRAAEDPAAGFETAAYFACEIADKSPSSSRFTPFVRALAPAIAWLARATGEAGATVWTPTSIEPVDGIRLAMTTLPVTGHVAGASTLDGLCAALQQALAASFDHRHVDTAHLVGLVPQAPGAGLAILFDLQDQRTDKPICFDGCPTLSLPEPVSTVRAQVEIAASINAAGQLYYRLRGRAGVYDRPTLEAWASGLASFAAAALARPDHPLAALPLIATDDATADPAKVAIIVPAPTVPRAAWDVPGRLAQRLKDGGGPRIITAHERLTGLDVMALADRTVQALQSAGAKPGDLVELALPRSAAYPAALLAAWIAGAVPILINPALPEALQDRMREVSGAGFRIAAARDGGLTVARVAGAREAGPAQALRGSDLAYGAFTSGTTGMPKLVLVPWTGLRQLLDWAAVAVPMGPLDRFLHVAAPGFDIGLFEMLHPLINGAGLVVAAAIDDPPGLAAFAAQAAATHLHFVPALLAAYLDASDAGQRVHVKLVMCGGDTVPVDLARRVLADGMAFQHCYGPTETTIFVASRAVTQSDLAQDFLELGEPVCGSGLAVCDPSGHPLPIGLPGELVVFGDAVASGYFGDSKATAARFEPSRFGPGRQYRTGDRVVLAPGRALRHLGRIDRQVKISGVRIEPAAIEAVLESLPQIARAAVLAVARGDAVQLIAAVRPAADRDYAEQDLAALLRANLADRFHAAAVPRHILILHEMPVTANGKIDYANLAQRAADWEMQPADPIDATDLAELGPRLAQLVGVWADALGRNATPDTNFFAHGGDSMAAIRMVTQAARAGLAFSIADVFRQPTPQLLFDLLNQRAAPACSMAAATAGHPAPLADAARDWLARTNTFALGDVLAVRVDLPPGTHGDQLADALARVLAHHDALRLQVQSAGASWTCSFATPYRPACPVCPDQATALACAELAVIPAQGRMLGAALVAATVPYAVLCVHHLAIDPAGWRTLTSELGRSLALGATYQPAFKPFSVSCAARDPALAIVPRRPKPALPRKHLSLELTLANLSQAALVAATARALAELPHAHTCIIAAERPGRAETEEGVIGWFTDFARWQSGSGLEQPETVAAAPDAAIDVIASIAASPASAGGWSVLQADVAPVHWLALEMCPGAAGGSAWRCELSADAGWSDGDLARFGAQIAEQLATRTDHMVLAATPLQLAMIAASVSGASSTAYHTQIVFEPTGEFDLAGVLAAWLDAHDRHDALRLRFALHAADPVIRLTIAPPQGAIEPLVTRFGDQANTAEYNLAAFLEADLVRGFAQHEPLSRIGLVQGHDGVRIVWSHHHAVLDGWSLNLVTQSVAACYAARQAGQPRPPTAPSIGPYLQWWHDQSPVATAQKARDLVASWPRGRPSEAPLRAAGSSSWTKLELDHQQSAALRDQAQTAGVTLFELCLAAVGIVDAQRRGDGAGAFRFIGAVRPAAVSQIDATVGLCMNVLPLYFPVSRSLTELLQNVRAAVAVAMAVATASPLAMASAIRAAGLEHRFDTVVVFENYPGDRSGVPLGSDGTLIVRSAREEGEARFTLVIMPDARLQFELLHPPDPQARSEAQALLDSLKRVLEHFTRQPSPSTAKATHGA